MRYLMLIGVMCAGFTNGLGDGFCLPFLLIKKLFKETSLFANNTGVLYWMGWTLGLLIIVSLIPGFIAAMQNRDSGGDDGGQYDEKHQSWGP